MGREERGEGRVQPAIEGSGGLRLAQAVGALAQLVERVRLRVPVLSPRAPPRHEPLVEEAAARVPIEEVDASLALLLTRLALALGVARGGLLERPAQRAHLRLQPAELRHRRRLLTVSVGDAPLVLAAQLIDLLLRLAVGDREALVELRRRGWRARAVFEGRHHPAAPRPDHAVRRVDLLLAPLDVDGLARRVQVGELLLELLVPLAKLDHLAAQLTVFVVRRARERACLRQRRQICRRERPAHARVWRRRTGVGLAPAHERDLALLAVHGRGRSLWWARCGRERGSAPILVHRRAPPRTNRAAKGYDRPSRRR